MKNWIVELRTSLLAVVALAVILCVLYPLSIWILTQGLFPVKANGSLIKQSGQIVGSGLIAQRFNGPGYFHPRPSNAGLGYDAVRSGGSNLGPLSKGLIETVRRRIADYRAINRLAPGTLVPADAVLASASGLDPHISQKNAWLQSPRVAKARGVSEEAVRHEIEACTEGRTLGILGEPRVNILLLNLALDGVRNASK